MPPREYSEQRRAQLAREHKALADGSYPIEDCGGLHDAVGAYGQAPESHRPALRALIRERHADLGGCGITLDKLEER